MDYEIFNKKYEELGQKTTLSKQEKELGKILENYVFYNDKTSKIFLDIQALEHIREFQGSEYKMLESTCIWCSGRNALTSFLIWRLKVSLLRRT